MRKTTFKIMFLLLAILVIGLIYVKFMGKSMGESVKDFYIPSQSNYNKVSFYTPDEKGGRTGMTRTIYYVSKDDGTYDITDSHLFQGETSSTITQTVKFTTTEVVMTQSVSTTMLETNKKQSYKSTRILLKMPATGQTTTWTVPGEEGPTIFTSSWTTLIIDGVSKKAIKVISQLTGWESKSVFYYVEGIGLYKTEFIENGTKTAFENFDGLSYEAMTR